MRPRQPVRLNPDQPGDVMQQEEQITFGRLAHHIVYNKAAYEFFERRAPRYTLIRPAPAD
jgi:hypothetical protein